MFDSFENDSGLKVPIVLKTSVKIKNFRVHRENVPLFIMIVFKNSTHLSSFMEIRKQPEGIKMQISLAIGKINASNT